MKHKIAELFFENPIREFYLRQIARLTKVPKTSVSRKLKELIDKKIIIRVKSEPFDKYIANEQNLLYLFYKKNHIIEKLYTSKLIDFLIEKTSPKAIVLFGSCSKGEYDNESDIDLCIISSQKELNLEKFNLKHDVQLFFFRSLSEIPRNLKHNIINGITLYGFLK
jgi:predicted nucleotidyltransferase